MSSFGAQGPQCPQQLPFTPEVQCTRTPTAPMASSGAQDLQLQSFQLTSDARDAHDSRDSRDSRRLESPSDPLRPMSQVTSHLDDAAEGSDPGSNPGSDPGLRKVDHPGEGVLGEAITHRGQVRCS